MKSILVLDTPKNCGECHMYYNAGFYCEPEHCPLSPLPQKEENHYTDEDYVSNVNYYIERLTENKNLYVNLSELVNRFIDVDEEYNHEGWNLMQILANINMVDHVKMEEK